ncbi:TIGR01620 family protein, partial [Xanthomonas citri pv. citri]|nr:TIGR01620 family protein [Xanthomonas citri pv. citri]
MKKQIFSEQEITTEQQFVAKQEFEASDDIQIEEEYQEVEAELIVEESLKPSRFWVRVLLFALGLFSVAVIAQSVQWLIDTFQARQWIYFAFAIVFALISLTGVVAI